MRPSIAGRARSRCVAIALLAGTAAAASAQQPLDTTALPEIVVTATRYPVHADSLGVSVTVLRGDELRAQGIRSVGDALRQVPGAQVVQGGGFGAQTSLFLRGGESDYVKVLVDGVPVNQPGGAYDFANLTTDNVERIEIVRGPGSVLYGSDAIAGVVQVVTRDGSGAPAASATAEGGTYGSFRWNAGASAGTDALGWSASASRRTTDGIYAFNDAYRNTVLSGRVRARPDASTTVALSGRFADGAFHFPTDFTGNPTDHNQSTAERTTTLALDLTRRLGRAVDGQLLIGRHAANNEFVNPPDSASDPSGFSDSRTDIRRWTVETRALLRLPAGVHGLAGVSLDDERQESFARAAADQPLTTSDSMRERTNWGFYAQAVVAPHPALQLTVGGRLDQNERFGSFGTYRVSALAFVTGLTRLRASVGTGFKEPGFFDNYATGFATGNPDLRPERSFSVEGGVTQEVPSLHAGVSLTGFAQRFRDLIQFTFAPPAPGGSNFFNVAAANAAGVEIGVTLRPVPGLELSGAYTRLHTEVTDAGFDSGEDATFVNGQRLLRRPNDLLTFSTRSTLSARWRAGAVLTVVGGRDDLRFAAFPEPTRRAALPSYGTLDLSGGWTVLAPRGITPGLDLTARVENVFDAAYEQAANYRSPGRTIIVGATAHVR
jgi:vitamin B12 transporter